MRLLLTVLLLVLLSCLAASDDALHSALHHSLLVGDGTLSDESLYLWRLDLLLSRSRCDLALNDEFAKILLSCWEIVKLTDLRSTLGETASWMVFVCESVNILLSTFHDDKVEARDIVSDDASTDRLSAALSLTFWDETNTSSTEKKLSSAVSEDTLHHWETFGISSTGYLEDISGIVLVEHLSLNFRGNTVTVELLYGMSVIKDDFDACSGNWVGNIKLIKYKIVIPK